MTGTSRHRLRRSDHGATGATFSARAGYNADIAALGREAHRLFAKRPAWKKSLSSYRYAARKRRPTLASVNFPPEAAE